MIRNVWAVTQGKITGRSPTVRGVAGNIGIAITRVFRAMQGLHVAGCLAFAPSRWAPAVPTDMGKKMAERKPHTQKPLDKLKA